MEIDFVVVVLLLLLLERIDRGAIGIVLVRNMRKVWLREICGER